MNKHTPGPWTVWSDLDIYGAYRIDEVAKEQENWVNAGFEESDEEGEKRQEISNEQDAGNATLIAAAPELLKALQNLAEVCDYHNQHRQYTEAAFKVIYKALYGD